MSSHRQLCQQLHCTNTKLRRSSPNTSEKFSNFKVKGYSTIAKLCCNDDIIKVINMIHICFQCFYKQSTYKNSLVITWQPAGPHPTHTDSTLPWIGTSLRSNNFISYNVNLQVYSDCRFWHIHSTKLTCLVNKYSLVMQKLGNDWILKFGNQNM